MSDIGAKNTTLIYSHIIGGIIFIIIGICILVFGLKQKNKLKNM